MTVADADTIVVGVDGSLCSEDALQWAISEAQRSNRHLLLVHAWQWASDVTTIAGASEGRKTARNLLSRAAADATEHGVHNRTAVVEGSAVGGLARTAFGAAMLVVGSHGRSALTRTLLGSVSRDCVQHATCPVVVVPARGPVGTHGQPLAAAQT